MAELDVVPPALVTAAAAVRAFGRELSPAGVTAGGLEEALATFTSRWSTALDAVADEADDIAQALQDAAADYLRLDRLLVPAALR